MVWLGKALPDQVRLPGHSCQLQENRSESGEPPKEKIFPTLWAGCSGLSGLFKPCSSCRTQADEGQHECQEYYTPLG